MRHIIWSDEPTYSTAVLVKASSFNKNEIENNYVNPLVLHGVSIKDVIAFTLDYNQDGKAPAKFMKEYLGNLLLALQSLAVKKLYVTDTGYFKTLTGQAKADPHFGYVLPCKIKGYEHMEVVLGLNYHALIYDPSLQAKLNLTIKTLADSIHGRYQAPGTGIIHSARYPQGLQEVADALESLHQYPSLTCDIEAFSLDFDKAGIGTLAFAWDKHNGLAFACDYNADPANPCRLITMDPPTLFEGEFDPDPAVRALIKEFLETYKGKITWHNAAYDVKVIVYTLWMKDGLDTKGLLEGLEVLTRNIDDTKIIAYLATNSTAGNVLGLKPLAQEFAGNWAVEVKDIRKVSLEKLLQYNLVDALSTWYVRDKYYPVMVADQQEELYHGLMLPSLKLIIQIELTGMPLNPEKVKEVRGKLEAVRDGHLDTLATSKVIQMLNLLLQQSEMEKANAKLKVKQHPLSKFADTVLNPNSPKQLQRLLYEQMCLPVIDLTDTKQPATGAETLEKLINHTQVPEYKEILEALIGYSKAEKILSTFIPAFEVAITKGDNVIWLHGSFNLGGTVSGRLSSSDPNLQNIPANSVYAKLIKECFVGPTGWLFCGADFNSLEDYVSALTTRDKNKLKVYTEGYDGHSLRAFSYYREELPEIRQAEPAERCFKIKFGTNTLTCKTGDLIILPTGEKLPVEEYFDTHTRL